MRKLFAALACLAACAFGTAGAREQIRPYEEYSRRLRDQEKVEPLRSDLFGDNLSLYNGATEFLVTDVDIPGNSQLPVRVQRRFRVESKKESENFGGFGAWDIEVPHIAGTFDAIRKWNTGAYSTMVNRCSELWYPRADTPLDMRDVWSGTQISIPGQGNRELLHVGTTGNQMPTADGPWYWTARDNFRLRCKPTTANGYYGEGFIAVDGNGTKYTFDVGVERHQPSVFKARTGVGRVKVYLLASRVEDRHGNWVNYTYGVPPGGTRVNLTRIEANDGRRIDLTYVGDEIKYATAHGRVWTYTYGSGQVGRGGKLLSDVTLPDLSSWHYDYNGSLEPMYPTPDIWADANCHEPEIATGMANGAAFSLVARHPAGAVGTFSFEYMRHGRSGTPSECLMDLPAPPAGTEPTYSLTSPDYYDVFSLKSKAISDSTTASRNPPTWSYAYERVSMRAGSPWPCQTCPASKEVIVTEPDGSKQISVFGVRYMDNDGRLLQTKTLSPTGEELRKQTNVYVQESDTRPFPDLIGGNGATDDPASQRNRPVKQQIIEQQGVTFTSTVNSFDAFARPLSQSKGSSLSAKANIESTVYRDNLARWVVGQVVSSKLSGVTQPTYSVQYDAVSDLPTELKQFGEIVQRYTYDMTSPQALGSLATVTDGRNNTIALSDYKRGIPRLLTLPSPLNAQESVVVDDWGKITSHTDAMNATTSYGYDPVGRLKVVTPPTDDQQPWNPTYIDYVRLAADDSLGFSAGLWQQTIRKGNLRKVVYFDGLWRPVLSHSYDVAAPAATARFVVRLFDHENRETFSSYPLPTLANWASASSGVSTVYDALGRPLQKFQDSELGQLSTGFSYLTGFQTRVTSPRGQVTTTSFQVTDKPDESYPTLIQQSEGITTSIARDKFNKPLIIERSGSYGGIPVAATRTYVYDSAQRLCKRVEPESGATIFNYDLAGNADWVVSGSALTAAVCDRSSVTAGERTTMVYDAMNRILSKTYPGAAQNLAFSYFADGKVNTATAGNVSKAFTYAKRGVMTSELLTQGETRYSLGYAYNADGIPSGISYPDGYSAQFSPNVFGEPTASGAYAYGATYAPNGMLNGYVYGNQISYYAQFNTRQLVSNFTYALSNGNLLVSHDLGYDPNANLLQITDLVGSHVRSRSMGYDMADRLISVTAAGAGMGGNEAFKYDVLDNLREATRNGQALAYSYDAGTNRLNSVGAGTSSAVSFTYDPRGNAASRNGVSLLFDQANRLTQVGTDIRYLYDASGRRFQRDGNTQLTNYLYSNDGQLLFEHDIAANKVTRYHYLGKRLVARVEDNPPVMVAPVLSVPATSTDGNFRVDWNSVNGAQYYRLEEKVASGNWVEVAQRTSLGWSPVPAKGDGTYQYRARACNYTCSPYSTVVSVTVSIVATLTAPVISVPAVAVNGNYDVTWSSVAGALDYMVEENNGAIWVEMEPHVTATVLQYRNRLSGTFGYRVRACRGACGPVSNEVWTQVVYAPASAPALTLPAQSTGSYQASWTSVSGATSYRIEEAADAGFTSPTEIAPGSGQAADATTRQITAHPAGTFYYRVRASNAAGNGPWSTVQSIQVTPAVGVPVFSGPADSTNTSGSYTISWSAVSGATYQLQEKVGSGGWADVSGVSGTSKSFSQRQSAVYTYHVRACIGANCGDWSAEKIVRVEVAPPPVPTNINIELWDGGARCKVSWSASSGATRYQVSWNGVTQLETGNTYDILETACTGTYRVRAGNFGAWSAFSGTSSVPTSAPTLTAPATSTTGAYRVQWTLVGGTEYYKLEENLNNGSQWTMIYNGDLRFLDISGRTTGDYRYRVSACIDTNACGPTSSVVLVDVDIVPPPTQVPSLSVNTQNPAGSYTVSWGTSSGATYYEMTEAVNGGTPVAVERANPGTTSQQFSNMPTAQYDYRVRACNISGCTSWSTALTVHNQVSSGAPSAPTGLQLQQIGGLCDLTWNASSGATKYWISNAGSEMDVGGVTHYRFDTQCLGTYAVRACNSSNQCSALSAPVGM